jgi:tetratricopeptide (TPR) repeat protein
MREDLSRIRHPDSKLKRQRTRSLSVGFMGLALILNGACVKRSGRTTNDNFYVINGSSRPFQPPREGLRGPQGVQLSESINKTLQAQVKSSPKSKSSVSNAELLERENPEFSTLLREAKVNPVSGEIRFRLGKAYHDLRMYDEAQVHYQKAIQLEPDNAVYYEHIGRLWRDWGAPDFGVNSLQKALQLKPDFAEAWNTLGTLYDRTGARSKAQESYFKALTLNPNLEYVHSNLCYSLLQDGSFEKAIHHGQEAVRLLPSSATAHNNLGLAYGVRGDFERAYEEFAQAADEASARNNLGLVLLAKNRAVDAMREFQRAARLRPFYRVAAENYRAAQSLLFESKRSSKAESRDRWRQSDIFEVLPSDTASGSLPINQVGLDFLSGSPISARADSRFPQCIGLPACEISAVKFEIEGSSVLLGRGQLLGELLNDSHYQLTRVVERPGLRSRTVIYYQPGCSRLAVEMAHRIPGNQMVLPVAHSTQHSELRIALGTDIQAPLEKLRPVEHGKTGR